MHYLNVKLAYEIGNLNKLTPPPPLVPQGYLIIRCFVGSNHRYKKKYRLLKFVLCSPLPLPRAFLQWPPTALSRQTRQVVHDINRSIFLRCLWLQP